MSALQGIKVLDLSRVLAGPHCGQLLAAFGADVIKIEDPGGDEIRSWFPQREGTSTNFHSVNAGKKGITLNLKAAEGRDVLDRLVAKADVLIHSFLPAVANRLGVDYERLRSINPDLVYCSISGYGSSGPLKDKPGYDLMLQAFTGMMMLTGEPGRGPIRTGTSTIDLSTGMLAFGGVVSALYARATGKCRGQEVRLSLLETGIGLLGYHVTNYLNAGFAGAQSGSGVGHIVPYQAWLCRDGYMLAGATNDPMWRRFCEAIDMGSLADDGRFRTTHDRRAHRAVLIPILEQCFAMRNIADWVERFDRLGVPASPVHTIDQVMSHEQVRATQMTVQLDDANGKPLHVLGVPVKMSATPGSVPCRPPNLGEHTDSVLRDLGFSDADLARLRTTGAI